MKKTIIRLVAGIIASLLLAGGVALASDGSKNIDIYYRNIKLMIDGMEYVPTDANGDVVEPFIYNGTTYLPVRAVATAFGKDVKWDGQNATVYLGKEGRMSPDNRLDKIQYTDYRENDPDSWMNIINGTVTDYLGNTYTNGLLFYREWDNTIVVEYPLNGQYSNLCGKIALPKSFENIVASEDNCRHSDTTVTIYDENDTQLYRAVGVTATMPFTFDIDVKGVNKITIRVETQERGCFVALTDLALYK